MRRWTIRFALALALPAGAAAATLDVRVDAGEGEAGHAVLSLHPLDTDPPPLAAGRASMDQRGLAFVPHVLPVQRGTEVHFPNSDQVRHHVYSFSPARRFELKLYKGDEAAPVRFDSAGIVTLGCNIHDRMLGYIVVLDTPWFAMPEADGLARIEAPPGRYLLRAWHPRLPRDAGPAEREVSLSEPGEQAAVALQLEPPPPPRALSPLEERFRRLREQQRAGPGD